MYGDVVPLSIPVNKVINLASNILGAEVVQKPLNLIRGNIPNIILDRANSRYFLTHKRVEQTLKPLVLYEK